MREWLRHPFITQRTAVMGIIDSKSTMSSPKGSSAPQNTSVGSGSRPTKSTHKIETSEPSNPHTMGRDVAGSLK
jgi:hypothetical protein